MFLESLCHEASCFVTLTYDEDHLPAGGSLLPEDPQQWLKRFRIALAPTRIRYFLVGEYGESSWRPHYHLSIFGVGPEVGPLIQQTWGKGWTSCYEFNETTAQYVAGYVIKKLTSKDMEALQGRYPEFARMSLRPGLGSAAMLKMSPLFLSGDLQRLVQNTGDVPHQLRLGKRSIPLGRYLRAQLRSAIGIPPATIEANKQRFLYERAIELQELFKATPGALSIKDAYLTSKTQEIRNVESRARVWKKKGSI